MGRGGVDCNNLAEVRSHWRALVNMVMSLRGSHVRELLSSCGNADMLRAEHIQEPCVHHVPSNHWNYGSVMNITGVHMQSYALHSCQIGFPEAVRVST
jgi:hypothetical protein